MIRRNPRILMTELEDEVVLLDPEEREMYSLNRTGGAVWAALPAASAEALASAVSEAFDVDPDVAVRDVETLLDELRAAGLVLVGPDDADGG